MKRKREQKVAACYLLDFNSLLLYACTCMYMLPVACYSLRMLGFCTCSIIKFGAKRKGFSFRLLGRSCRLFAASVPNPKKHGILNTKAVHSLASFLYRWILSYHIRQRSKKKGFQSHRICCHFLPPFPPFFFLLLQYSKRKLSFGEESNQGNNPSYLVV